MKSTEEGANNNEKKKQKEMDLNKSNTSKDYAQINNDLNNTLNNLESDNGTYEEFNFYKDDVGTEINDFANIDNVYNKSENVEKSHYIDPIHEFDNIQQQGYSENNVFNNSYTSRLSDASLNESSDKERSSDSNYSRHDVEDSEATNVDIPDEPTHNKFVDILSDVFYNKKCVFIVIGTVLGVLSFFTMNINVPIETASGLGELPLGRGFVMFCLTILLTVLLGWFIELITFKILKNTISNTNTVVFYINGCAFHISLMISIVSLWIFVTFTTGNFAVGSFSDFELHTKIICPMTLVFIFIFALQKCLTQSTTFSFNYSTYLKRIKRVLFMDLFVNIMTNINDFKKAEEDEYVYEGPLERYVDDNDIFVPRLSMSSKRKILQTYIFDTQFTSSRNLMTFGTKFILLNEFKNICRAYKHNTNSILTVLNKIKDKAKHKSEIFYKKLVRDKKMKTLNDFKYVFKDNTMFNIFMEQNGVKKSDEITKDFLEFFLEKCYKEKYMISYSLKQLHTAIDRVSVAVQVLVILVYILCIFLTGKTDKDSKEGIVGAVLGIPIIASLLKDNLIHPIMFLFVTHPYDVGDRVLVKLSDKLENLVVSELNVFSTHFYRWDGTCFFVPNTVLAHTAICNIRRSGPLMEYHHIQISAKTEARKLCELKKNLQKFVKKYPNYYTDYILVNYEKVVDSNKLFIKVLMQYKTNIQNYEHYLGLKSNFICYLNKQISQLGMGYNLPVQTISLKERVPTKEQSTKV